MTHPNDPQHAPDNPCADGHTVDCVQEAVRRHLDRIRRHVNPPTYDPQQGDPF